MREKKEKEKKRKPKKSKLNMTDLQTIQQYIILCLLSGIFIAPRRSLDYTEFKISNIDKDTDNYLDKNELVFNKYIIDAGVPNGVYDGLTKYLRDEGYKNV